MIDVEQLRSKILDLAISGKLVPQDPNDEPASVLLERIQKEKEALVKTGKIKKADPPSIIYKGSGNRYYEKVVGGSVDVTNEIPFAIPDGWSFVRLKDLVYFGGGKTPSMDVSGNWNPGTTNWVTSKDVKSKTIHESRIKVSDKGAKELALYPASSLVLVMRSGILRHSVPIAILSSPSTVNQDIKVLVPFVSAMMGFIYLFFSASTKFILDHCSKDGTTVESLDSKKVENILLPLPGLDEQKRIVDCSDEVVKKCDSLAQSMRENAGLGAKLKEKILCYFFAKNSDKSYYGKRTKITLGKLVPCEKIGDGDWVLSENMDENGTIRLIQLKHIGFGEFLNKPFAKVNEQFFLSKNCSKILSGDLLIDRLVSDQMDCCILPRLSFEAITSVDVCWIRADQAYNSKYLMYYFLSPEFQGQVLNACSGSTRKRISKTNLINIPLFIHGRAVQDRVVNEIEKLFSQIDLLSA
jgi:restriction endonuclease S subunit